MNDSYTGREATVSVFLGLRGFLLRGTFSPRQTDRIDQSIYR